MYPRHNRGCTDLRPKAYIALHRLLMHRQATGNHHSHVQVGAWSETRASWQYSLCAGEDIFTPATVWSYTSMKQNKQLNKQKNSGPLYVHAVSGTQLVIWHNKGHHRPKGTGKKRVRSSKQDLCSTEGESQKVINMTCNFGY